jgi:hypothetical protein
MNISHSTINRALAQANDIDWTTLGQRLHDLLELDRQHPSRPDGYPTSTPGANPSTTITPIGNPTEAPPDGTTETAAWAMQTWRDTIHHQTMTAAEHLIEAANHAQAALNVAGRYIPALPANNRTSEPLNNDRRCWIMETIGHHDPAYRITDFAGYIEPPLDMPRPVGRWAYRFVRDWGRLPTDTEKRTHARGNNVKGRA